MPHGLTPRELRGGVLRFKTVQFIGSLFAGSALEKILNGLAVDKMLTRKIIAVVAIREALPVGTR